MGCILAGMMEDVLAKSDGKSLLQHLDECLLVFSELREALPMLPKITQLEEFWQLLFFAVYLHDFGKAHVEFQKVLNGEPNFWNRQRHEIYSIPFVDKLGLSNDQKLLIKRAILGHHKDFSHLLQRYRDQNDLQFEYETIWKRKKNYPEDRRFHPEDYVQNLAYNMCHDYLRDLFEQVKEKYKNLFQQSIPFSFRTVSFQTQKHPIIQIAKPALKDELPPAATPYWQNLLLGAATKICDHYGSAEIKKVHRLQGENFNFLENFRLRLQREGKDFYEHQEKCSEAEGNCLLVAPTGSGKTEAAMAWLKRQVGISQGRSFYVLPYTASINAMHKRLIKAFVGDEKGEQNDLVGIQHGKLTQYLSSFFEEATFTKSANLEKNKRIGNLIGCYKKMIFPLKITTPFQLLKYFYGVKGFDMGFAELAGAKLIFDEIHAYDEITFAQILVSLEHFSKYLDCSVMVMTATLPSFMMKELKKTLGIVRPIRASESLLENFNRHSVHVLKGGLLDQLPLIEQRILAGERVMIVCNTVRAAQEIFQRIQESGLLNQDEIALLHGRFHYIDRMDKEESALDESTKVLVGTQAIEVSLDADFDVLFSEPAPLDALLQRFGRVNRRRKMDFADVFVCDVSGKHDHYIYPLEVVEKTLTLLKNLEIIKEIELQDYLDFVCPDWSPKQKRQFDDTKQGFEASLKALQPYTAHKEREEQFYDKFDGIQVLPSQFLPKYRNLVSNFDFFEAEKYLVTIYRGMYFKLREEGWIEHIPLKIENLKGKILDKSVTVALCKYSPELGLLDEYEAINDVEDRIA